MITQYPTNLQQNIKIWQVFLFLTIILTTYSLTAQDLQYQTHVEQICTANELTLFHHSLGKTARGNQLYVLGITASKDVNKNKYQDYIGSPAILLTSTMHAREDVSFRFLYSAIDHIVEEYGNGNEQVRYLLSRVVLLVMPFVNIDSVMHSFKLSEAQVLKLRKNMNEKGSKECKAISDRGVDINRNFDYNFGTVDTSNYPCSEQYHGAGPFSQPESQAIRTLFEQFEITTNIDIHGYGNIWIYPYASDKKTDKIKQHKLYPQYQHIFHKFKQFNVDVDNCFNSLKYVADGVYIDWALSKNSLSFALEFGDDFLVVGEQTDRHIDAMLEVFKINTNIFSYYLKTSQKSLQTSTNTNDIRLCVKSLSVLEHNVILMINDEVVEARRLTSGGRTCFTTNLDRLINMPSLHKQKVYVKLGESNLKEQVVLHELNESKEETEEQEVGQQKTGGLWKLYSQFKILIFTVLILCGIGCLCGLSIFFQKSLGVRSSDEQGQRLNQIQINSEGGPRLRSSRMLGRLRGQNIQDNRVMESEIEPQTDSRMGSISQRSDEQVQTQDVST